MSTMLKDFLSSNGFTAEGLIAASKTIENRSIEDRSLAVKRANARSAKKTYAELELTKPKSLGRGLGAAAVTLALDGKPVARLTRKKIVRAVNEMLASKKKDPVEWRQLFADAHIKGWKPKAED
jgi:hypothetical protein